jgi:hypothetical protein
MEERRFDELSRALGQGVPRRTVLKGLLGAAVGSALAVVGVRVPQPAGAAPGNCNGVSYDPNTQCCTPAGGIQPMYPIADLALCPDRVPHAGHVPEFNGCGPANGFLSRIIPNKIGPFRNVDLTQACNNHDICYDTCNSVKSTCDQNFLADLKAACATAYPGQGPLDRYMRAGCTFDAYIYYAAVSQTPTGVDAYESAQKGACDCCANCAQCGGTGDERCCQGTCHDACPDGKTRDPQTCDCVCAESCPPDKHQNPDTCECEDLCANVTCNECHVCDPQTGNCIVGNDQAPCGSGQVCCGGECKDECSCPEPRIMCNGVCCPENQICVEGVCQAPTGCNPACGPDEICCNEIGILDNEGHTETWVCKSTAEYKICPVSPNDGRLVSGLRDDYICCPIELECCGGDGPLFNTCGGHDGICCKAGTSECGGMCCNFGWEEGTCHFNSEAQQYECVPLGG